MGQPFDAYHKWLGIPPAEQPPNHYRLLGLTLFETDLDAIQSAAEQRIAHVRTFQISEHAELSQRILNELAAARVCLLNPQKKAAYDGQLPRKLNPRQSSIGDHAHASPVIRPLKSRKTISRTASNRRLVMGLAAAVVAVALTCLLLLAFNSRLAKDSGSDNPSHEVADASRVGETAELGGTFRPNSPTPGRDALPLPAEV